MQVNIAAYLICCVVNEWVELKEAYRLELPLLWLVDMKSGLLQCLPMYQHEISVAIGTASWYL